jgi:hypothetical protein
MHERQIDQANVARRKIGSGSHRNDVGQSRSHHSGIVGVGSIGPKVQLSGSSVQEPLTRRIQFFKDILDLVVCSRATDQRANRQASTFA